MGNETDADPDTRDVYNTILQTIVDRMNALLGQKISLTQARKAPIEIGSDGTVQEFYGDGRSAVRILFEQYTEYTGELVARNQITRALEQIDDDLEELLPDNLTPADD